MIFTMTGQNALMEERWPTWPCMQIVISSKLEKGFDSALDTPSNFQGKKDKI